MRLVSRNQVHLDLGCGLVAAGDLLCCRRGLVILQVGVVRVAIAIVLLLLVDRQQSLSQQLMPISAMSPVRNSCKGVILWNCSTRGM